MDMIFLEMEVREGGRGWAVVGWDSPSASYYRLAWLVIRSTEVK